MKKKKTFFIELSLIPDIIFNNLNAEFQRTAKKVFLSEQCKEIEESNRMGKTGDLLKKIRDTREHFTQRLAQLGQK